MIVRSVIVLKIGCTFQDFVINFDPKILELVKEAKSMQRLNLDVSFFSALTFFMLNVSKRSRNFGTQSVAISRRTNSKI